MRVFRDEIFGPVLAVSEFASLDEALRDRQRLHLRAVVGHFHQGPRRQRGRYVDEIEAGLAHVNIHTGYKEPSMPFGGFKQSGAGLPENSQSGLEFFVDRKAVYIK